MRPSTQRKKEKGEYAAKKLKKNKKENALIPRPVSALTKYVDYHTTTLRVCSDIRITLLNGIACGTESYQRVGRVVMAKNLKLSITFSMITSVVLTFPGDMARLIVLWDKQGTTTPVASDILWDVSAAGTTQTSYVGFKNPNNKERFVHLYDKRFQLPSYIVTVANSVASTPCPQMPNITEWRPDIDIDLDGLMTRYKDTGSTIASISEGALYFFILGTTPNATAGWNVTFKARYSYYDS